MKLRIMPIFVSVAALAFCLKVGGIWQDWNRIGSAQAADSAAVALPISTQAGPTAVAALSNLAPAAGGDEEAAPATMQPGEHAADPAATTVPSVMDTPDPFDMSDEEIELLQRLSDRRQEIDRREREIEQRAALLEAAEKRVEQKIGELSTLQATIQALLVAHDEQEDAQMRSLVKIYENMKPKEAARIFEQLDMVVLLEVIDRMKERKAAPILAKMTPAKAKAVTLELAQRRELPIAKN